MKEKLSLLSSTLTDNYSADNNKCFFWCYYFDK